MKVVFSTGAGISVPSGLRPYRGEGGLWTENPELEAKSNRTGINEYLEDLWAEWGPFRAKLKETEPNEAHMTIARLQAHCSEDVTVITQNVDDLHMKALLKATQEDPYNTCLPVARNKILELHGNVLRIRCVNDECWASKAPVPEDESTEISSCGVCGEANRPDIVLFGENLHDLDKAQGACLAAHLFIAVGTSGMVYPASELVSVAKGNGARTILVNAQEWEYPHPDFDETIIGKAEEILDDILERELGTASR